MTMMHQGHYSLLHGVDAYREREETIGGDEVFGVVDD